MRTRLAATGALAGAAALVVGTVVPTGAVPVGTGTFGDGAVQQRIVHGRAPQAGEFPFLVALADRATYTERGLFQAQFCGGTLVSPTIVVTAAHCLTEPTGDDVIVAPPSAILVAAVRDLAAPNPRVIDVTAVNVNPTYEPMRSSGDIATLTLATPIEGVPVAKPVMAQDASRLEVTGTAVESAGWGALREGVNTYPDVFRVADLVLFPPATCGGGKPYTLNGVRFQGFDQSEADPETMLCAGGVTAKKQIIDTCQGDSGGPLTVPDGDETRLIGIVSWGEGCARDTPGVYTRVSQYTTFLRNAGLDLTGLPSPPRIVNVSSGQGHLHVRVGKPVDDGGSPVTSYTVTAKALSAVAPDAACTATPEKPLCTVYGVRPGVTYRLTALAVTEAGTSAPSKAVQANPYGPPERPVIQRRVPMTDGRVWFKVERPWANGSTITWLRVECSTKGAATRAATVTKGTAVVQRMSPKRTYSCVAKASNAAGTSVSKPVKARPLT
ncbi:MAG: trypsin-like serine protease [Candidatus Nanopelagicales bacterium]